MKIAHQNLELLTEFFVSKAMTTLIGSLCCAAREVIQANLRICSCWFHFNGNGHRTCSWVSMDLPVISYCSGLKTLETVMNSPVNSMAVKWMSNHQHRKRWRWCWRDHFLQMMGNRVDLPMLKMCQLEQVPQEFNSRNDRA